MSEENTNTDSSEIYFMLGHDENFFYFCHVLNNSAEYDSRLDAQIYNCLINETMVHDYNKACVVWTVNKDSSISTTFTLHKNTKIEIGFDKEISEALKLKLKQCLEAERNETLIFKYIYPIDAFAVHEIELNTNDIFNIDISKCTFNKPVAYKSAKEIEYLPELERIKNAMKINNQTDQQKD